MNKEKSQFSLFAILLLFPLLLNAEQTVGPAAKKASELALADNETTIEQKLLRTLLLINVENYNHQLTNEKTPELPVGGHHPYEWDSLRSSEQMLSERDGGSCGTHALSMAAILRASGVPSENLRLIGTVEASDYADICPGPANSKRKTEWELEPGQKTEVHPGNGHVFLEVKIKDQWVLVNSTHDPLIDPIHPKSEAHQVYEAVLKDCKKKKGVCFREARKKASALLQLEDFEMTRFVSPDKMALKAGTPPTLIPMPSFKSYRNGEGSSGLVVFQTWSFEEYPKHDIKDRINMIASGKATESECRWSGAEVMSLAQAQAVPPSSKSELPPVVHGVPSPKPLDKGTSTNEKSH